MADIIFPDAANAFAKAQSIQTNALRDRLLMTQASREEAAYQRDNQARPLYAKAVAGDNAAAGQLAGLSPELHATLMKAKKEGREQQLHEYNSRVQLVGQAAGSILALPPDQRPGAYQAQRQRLLSSGLITAEQVPEQYNEALVTSAARNAQSVDALLKSLDEAPKAMTPAGMVPTSQMGRPAAPVSAAPPPPGGTGAAAPAPRMTLGDVSRGGSPMAVAGQLAPDTGSLLTEKATAFQQAGIPIRVTSGFRNPQQNADAGGATHSQHLDGKAFDVAIGHLPPEQQQAVINGFLSDPRVGGFGYYPEKGSIHIDTRPNSRAAWGSTQRADSVGAGWPDWMTARVQQWQGGAGLSMQAQTMPVPPSRPQGLGPTMGPGVGAIAMAPGAGGAAGFRPGVPSGAFSGSAVRGPAPPPMSAGTVVAATMPDAPLPADVPAAGALPAQAQTPPPPMQASPDAPSPIFIKGKPYTEGAPPGFQWGMQNGQWVQMQVPGSESADKDMVQVNDPTSPTGVRAVPRYQQRNGYVPAKDPTEGQANANLYATRMREAEAAIQKFEKEGLSYSSRAVSNAVDAPYSPIPRLAENALTSSDYKQLRQAEVNFITAVLRRESGASISQSEFAEAARVYFPAPGDNDAILAQKRAARKSAIEGVGRASQPGFGDAGPTGTPPAPPGGSLAPAATPAPANGIPPPPPGFQLVR